MKKLKVQKMGYSNLDHDFLITMNFNTKMDDKKIVVDLESTQLKEVLLYCKPKERLILMRKF